MLEFKKIQEFNWILCFLIKKLKKKKIDNAYLIKNNIFKKILF